MRKVSVTYLSMLRPRVEDGGGVGGGGGGADHGKLTQKAIPWVGILTHDHKLLQEGNLTTCQWQKKRCLRVGIGLWLHENF